jgi:hypothetical protein
MLWFLVNDQRDEQFFSMYLFSFLTPYMFGAHRAHHQETNCVNTTSGNCHSVSVAVSYAGRTCTRQLPEVVLTQFVSPDDDHDVFQTCRELKMKINT